MIKLFRLTAIVLFFTLFSWAETSAVEVEKGKEGIYQSIIEYKFSGVHIGYYVDTNTQLCFSGKFGYGMVLIPCESLAKRPEWKSIITWVGNNENNSIKTNEEKPNLDVVPQKSDVRE